MRGVVLALALWQSAWAAPASQAEVDEHRARITRTRHAIEETRHVLATAAGGPQEPELLLRLAELTAEEARHHYRLAAALQADRGDALYVPQVRLLKEEAVEIYRSLVARFPSADVAPRALYDISEEQRELGMPDERVETLEQLVERYPTSRYAAEAHLALGDVFFDKGDMVSSRAQFEALTGPENPYAAMAHYKLGWVAYNEGDCEAAVVSYEAALDAPPQVDRVDRLSARMGEFRLPDTMVVSASDDPDALRVSREALVDMTYCYAQVRESEGAVQYLRERADRRTDLIAALRKLTRRYVVVEESAGAAVAMREVLAIAPDEPARKDDARLLHALLVRSGDYTQVGNDVALLLQVLQRSRARLRLGAEDERALYQEFSDLTRDLVLRAHEDLEMRPYPGAREQVLYAYTRWLEVFAEHPARGEMLLNSADLRADANLWVDAARAYQEAGEILSQPTPEPEAAEPVAEEIPADEPSDEPPAEDAPAEEAPAEESEPIATAAEEEDAAVDAVLGELEGPATREREAPSTALHARLQAAASWQRVLDGDATDEARCLARAGLRATSKGLLRERDLKTEDRRTLVFALANASLDEGDLARAAVLLETVAWEYPGTPQGDAAVGLALAAYQRSGDFPGLIRAGQRFLADDSSVVASVQATVAPGVSAAEQRLLDQLTLDASGDQAGAMERLVAFAERYKDSDLGERAMLGTFLASQAQGDATDLYRVGDEVLSRFPESEQAAGVVATMGQTAAKRYELETALDYLTQSAERQSEPNQRAAVWMTVGGLAREMGRSEQAEAAFRHALSQDAPPQVRSEAREQLAQLWDQVKSAKERMALLAEGDEASSPEWSSRRALLVLAEGDTYGAEDLLYPLMGSDGAGQTNARVHYGIAESTRASLELFEGYSDLAAIDELVGLIEVTTDAYLDTVRQGDTAYAQAALARLAGAAEVGAKQLRALPAPDGLSPDDVERVRQALEARAVQLEASREEVLKECARRVLASHYYDAQSAACLIGGDAPAQAEPESVRRWTPIPASAAVTAARENLKGSQDLSALRELGAAFLADGDAHAARLVYRDLAAGEAEPTDLLQLGRAAENAGAKWEALSAFDRAASLGLEEAATARAELAQSLGIDPNIWEVQ